MKIKTLLLAMVLLIPATAKAGKYYSLEQSASSASMKLAGEIRVYDNLVTTYPTWLIEGSGGVMKLFDPSNLAGPATIILRGNGNAEAGYLLLDALSQVAPASSGTNRNSTFRMQSTAHGPALDGGIYLNSPYGAYLQSTDISNQATNYPITLSPNGGGVTIGGPNDGLAGTLTVDVNTVFKGTAPWVDVRAFGAIADSSTDNTTFIQNAINYLAGSVTNSKGGIVYFPPNSNTYDITAPLKVPANITLKGAGHRASLIRNLGSGTYAVQLGTNSTQINFGTGIRDLGIYLGTVYSHGILLYATNGAEIHDVYVEGIASTGTVASPRTATCIRVDGATISSYFNSITNVFCNHVKTGVLFQTTALGGTHSTQSIFTNVSVNGDETTYPGNGSIGYDFDITGLGDGESTNIYGGDLESLTTGFYMRPNAIAVSMFGGRFESNALDVLVSTGAYPSRFIGTSFVTISSAAANNLTILGNVRNGGAYDNTLGKLEITNGFLRLVRKTIAQLMALTPALGDMYSCTDCTLTYDVVIGTGTTIGAFRETGTNHGPQ